MVLASRVLDALCDQVVRAASPVRSRGSYMTSAKPATSRHHSAAVFGLVAGLVLVGGCSRQDGIGKGPAAIDSVMVSAPRAPTEGRNPADRLLFVSGKDKKQGLIDTLGRIV